MTRYTNMGQRKRKIHEAGFNDLFDKPGAEVPEKEDKGVNPGVAQEIAADGEPAKKKRKRSKKKTDQNEPEEDGGQPAPSSATASTLKSKLAPHSKTDKFKRVKGVPEKAIASEQRRQKRIQERHVHTICFSCRQKGHAAKDCPSARSALESEGGGADEDGLAAGNSVVGICYRCGSQKHTLSRCRQPAIPGNPFPHASCFVCSGKGHLASSCPKNGGRGIYPNGGCCKLCGDVTHLARDCTVGKDAPTSEPIILGQEQATKTGADEDDFHTVKWRRLELERAEGKLKKQRAVAARAKVAALPPSKKVVTFS